MLNNHTIRLLLVSCGVLAVLLPDVYAQPHLDQAAEELRRRLEVAAGTRDIAVGNERVHTETSLARFYEGRSYHLAWTNDGRVAQNVEALLTAIRQSAREGMQPGDYHLSRLEQVLAHLADQQHTEKGPSPGLLVDLDLLCTDAFLLQAAHRLSGRVDPETIDREWIANRQSRDLVELLETALSEETIAASLKELLPPQREYVQLRESLQQYREIEHAGGWPVVPDGPTLQRGNHGSRVAVLRNRLARESYHISAADSSEIQFEESLDKAVRMFQDRHGLEADGIVGPITLRALNVSAGARARQIALNMERWRWLPQDLGSRHIMVNIAGFWLEVMENRESVLDMRVIVGRSYRRTPVFSDEITYLVLNPYWNVPHSIATYDILPQVKYDSSYLSKQRMKLLDGWGTDTRIIDPSTVDWSRITATSFPYRIRQKPGPNNALGMVKFMFPNRFSVYLHDTPARELFARSMRTFSSGCIRVEKPVELAAYLLKDQSEWTEEKIRQRSGQTQEQTIRLTQPIPIHLLYWTSWVDEADRIQFREDVYGRDLLLENALEKAPPRPTMP